MIQTLSVETESLPVEDSIIRRLDSRAPLLSHKRASSPRPEELHPEGMQRLWIAVINRAVGDLLEKGSYASEAERWLSSGDFDQIHSLLG
jgi:hypothetical protein